MNIVDKLAKLTRWLESTWHMIHQTLTNMDVIDLKNTYTHKWQGQLYAISCQWTIWRIMAHDIHHGGELSLMLGRQGIQAFELGDLGGHITELPFAETP
jgi:hypothetical protein